LNQGLQPTEVFAKKALTLLLTSSTLGGRETTGSVGVSDIPNQEQDFLLCKRLFIK